MGFPCASSPRKSTWSWPRRYRVTPAGTGSKRAVRSLKKRWRPKRSSILAGLPMTPPTFLRSRRCRAYSSSMWNDALFCASCLSGHSKKVRRASLRRTFAPSNSSSVGLLLSCRCTASTVAANDGSRSVSVGRDSAVRSSPPHPSRTAAASSEVASAVASASSKGMSGSSSKVRCTSSRLRLVSKTSSCPGPSRLTCIWSKVRSTAAAESSAESLPAGTETSFDCWNRTHARLCSVRMMRFSSGRVTSRSLSSSSRNMLSASRYRSA